MKWTHTAACVAAIIGTLGVCALLNQCAGNYYTTRERVIKACYESSRSECQQILHNY